MNRRRIGESANKELLLQKSLMGVPLIGRISSKGCVGQGYRAEARSPQPAGFAAMR